MEKFTSISVSASGQSGKPTAASTYHLYLEAEPGNGFPINTNSLASVVIPSNLSNEEEIKFDLNTPFPVVNGTTYRFVVAFDAGGQIRLSYNSGGNDYIDGHFVEGDDEYWTNGDLDFQVAIQSPPNPSVPTISEWGLLILALLLMTLGTLYLVQQPRFEQEG